MTTATVGEAVIQAIEEENYPALLGLLLAHARQGGGVTLVLRLLERASIHDVIAIIREMESKEDDDVHRLASAAVEWTCSYMEMLHDD